MSNIITISNYSGHRISGAGPLHKEVTTVWLLSTLGSTRINGSERNSNGSSLLPSALKKKDIMNVSIPRTCKVIQNSDLQLPLRFVSNLLYGVTVCYHRKAEYMLSDLTALITQLQRKIYMSPLQKKKSGKSNHVATIFDDPSAANGLLNDDPLFDINQLNRFSDVLAPVDSRATTEAMTIRKQDFMNELTNSNNYDDAKNSTDSTDRINRPLTLEDIPIDVDFNFDIDDVISQQGTSYHSKTSSQRGDNDFLMKYDKQEFNLNFEENFQAPAEETGIDLGIEDDEASLEDEDGNDEVEMPPLKKTRTSATSGTFYQVVHIDERTGLSTDTLRSNHDRYFAIMDSKRKKKRKVSHGSEANWQILMNLDDETNLIQRCWRVVFSAPGRGNLTSFMSRQVMSDQNSVERGRKRAWSLASERSSSVTSEEQGRRAVSTRGEFSETENNLFLNIDQIDEELNENDSTSNSDLLQINLELPPSSFGRVNTQGRTVGSDFRSSSHGGHSLDVVDELNRQFKTRRRKAVEEDASTIVSDDSSQLSLNSRGNQPEQPLLGPMVLDSHTRKFYDYIKERCSYVGKTTRSSPPFQKKMLFEDVVPSTLSVLDTDTDSQQAVVTDRKIAASAFLSLLSLASKDLIKIKCYNDHAQARSEFEIMNGDDIVIYA